MTVSDYHLNYKAFSQNIAFACRSWHSYVHLMNSAPDGSLLLDVLNEATRFWLDFKFTSVQTTIIFLGKVLDKDERSLSIHSLLKILPNILDYFTPASLVIRKIEQGCNREVAHTFVKSAHALCSEDIQQINDSLEDAMTIWTRIAPLRNKVYAHHDKLSDQDRKELYNGVKNKDVTDIIQILLNISDALLEAEINGRKPNLAIDSLRTVQDTKRDTDDLISSLLLGH